MRRETRRNTIQSVVRAFQVLETISLDQPIGLSFLVSKTGLKKTTVSRIAATLKTIGYVQQNPFDKTFSLSVKAFEIGSRILERLDVRLVGRPLIKEFVASKQMSVLVSVLDGNNVVYIDKVTASETFRISMTVGNRAPAYCSASGKAMLAFLDPQTRKNLLSKDELVPLTKKTRTDSQALESDFRETQKRGFSIDQGERIEGVCSVGAPIFDRNGHVVAAVSIPRMAVTITKQDLYGLGKQLVELAKSISRSLGWKEGF